MRICSAREVLRIPHKLSNRTVQDLQNTAICVPSYRILPPSHHTIPLATHHHRTAILCLRGHRTGRNGAHVMSAVRYIDLFKQQRSGPSEDTRGERDILETRSRSTAIKVVQYRLAWLCTGRKARNRKVAPLAEHGFEVFSSMLRSVIHGREDEVHQDAVRVLFVLMGDQRSTCALEWSVVLHSKRAQSRGESLR